MTFPFADGFGSSNGSASVEAVTTDGTGNIFITGGFTGTVSFGTISLTSAGNTDVFVAKLNSSGNVLWAARMGSADTTVGDFGRAIAVDASGNAYVTGFFAGSASFGSTTINSAGGHDVFVEKLDASGNVTWAEGFGSSGNDQGQAIAVDGSGVVVAGAFVNSISFGNNAFTSAGGNDAFVVRLDGNGGVTWARQEGGPGDDQAYGLGVDPNGNVMVTGFFDGQAVFGNVTLTSSSNSFDIFVAKLNGSDGTVAWAQSAGGPGTDVGTALAVDANGNVYVTGTIEQTATFGNVNLTSAGGDDLFVAKYDNNGGLLWAREAGGPGSDQPYGIALDSNDNVYVTGAFQYGASFFPQAVYSYGDLDAFLAKYNSTGTLEDAERFGGTGADRGFQVAVDPSNRIDIVGDYGGSGSFGDKTLPDQGSGFVGQLVQTANQGETALDFDGVGHTELAVFRQATAQWFILGPQGGYGINFGAPNLSDIPVPGDYDGVGKTELAVYRPSNSLWFALNPTSGGHVVANFGGSGDTPVPGDYDGVGKTELAVYRPATGDWFAMNPTTGGHLIGNLGLPGDIPVPGDYDGIGKTEVAVFRPSTSQWIVLNPTTGSHVIASFGGPGDIPVPGDYDGVGHAELAVFRPSTSQWFMLSPTGGKSIFFGAPNLADIPLEAPIGTLVSTGVLTPSSVQASAQTSALYVVVPPPKPAGTAATTVRDLAIDAIASDPTSTS